jgi:hypothetical protein
VTPF